MTVLRRIDEAVLMTERGEYLQALTEFMDIYGTEDAPPLNSAKMASGLSYFGLCLALVQKKYKAGADLCKRALDLEFYNGDHYANLARVYVLIGNRKKAVETADAGLKIAPESEQLKRVRSELGVRARPTVPFLDRSNPINVSLGQARHAKKIADAEVAPPRKKIIAGRPSRVSPHQRRGGSGK
ncbi:MAG TPA: tetratricopeptide repeat protein [Thermoanaerobaculia bacterium]|nr:tetratricopeptide repeat protein [Thermoanaerobaculia bacterium]